MLFSPDILRVLDISKNNGVPFYARNPNGLAFPDVLPSTTRRVLDFAIIGSPKCATTSVFDYLSQHPQINNSSIKEPHFFSVDALYSHGEPWLSGLFNLSSKNSRLGESSVSYSASLDTKLVAERMKKHNPEMQIFYFVRNPVERIQSDCQQVIKYLTNVFGLDFERYYLDNFFDLFEKDSKKFGYSFLNTSKYYEIYNIYRSVFGHKNVHIFKYEDYSRNMIKLLGRICEILAIDDDFSFSIEKIKNHSSTDNTQLHINRLSKKLRENNFYNIIRKKIPAPIKRSIQLKLANKYNHQFNYFSQTKINELNQYFFSLRQRFIADLPIYVDDWFL